VSHDLSTFFLPDLPDAVEDYQTLRDSAEGFAPSCRDEVNRLWAGFLDVCPDHPDQFRRQAAANLLGQVWTMWLARLLRSAGFKLEKAKAEGPDLTFLQGGRRYWIECIAAQPAEAAEFLERAYRNGAGASAPAEQKRILRLTNALDAKREAFAKNEAKRIVASGDVRINAISSGDLPGTDLVARDGLYPDIVKAAFGVGRPVFVLPVYVGHEDVPQPPPEIRTGYSPRKSVQKREGVDIPCTPFEGDTRYSGISGVYHHALPLWPLLGGSGSLDFLHNPRADVRVPLDELPCLREYTKDADAAEKHIMAHDRRERWKARFRG